MISFIVVYKDLLTNRPKITTNFFKMMTAILDRNRGCECIICDYGSEDNIQTFLNEQINGFRYVYVEPNEDQWINIPKGLNAGIFNARMPIVAPIGPDLRFSDDVIRSSIDLFRILGSFILRIECFKFDKDDKFEKHTYSPYLLLKSDVLRSRGFDERMFGWGKEEDDLIERMFRYQALMEMKVRGIAYKHVWHPETLREKYDTTGNMNQQFLYENVENNAKNAVNSYW